MQFGKLPLRLRWPNTLCALRCVALRCVQVREKTIKIDMECEILVEVELLAESNMHATITL